MKNLEKKMEHQSAVLDGFAGSLAQLTAAFGRPPVDSPGVTRVLDTTLSQGELLKELESHVGQMRDAHEELLQLTREVRERQPERAPYREPPPRAAQGSADVQTQARPQPQVIDLQSRIPLVRPVFSHAGVGVGAGIATVTYSDGTRAAIREDEIRAFTG